jgi:hypothetical protein
MVTSRPNTTHVRAVLTAFTPAADGYGGELDLRVLRNESASAEEDFLRPHEGSTLKAFIHEAPAIEAGHEVNVQLTFLGGLQGSRAVVQTITKAK